MQFEHWAPLYEEIRASLDFDWARERASADRLRALLDVRTRPPPVDRLEARLVGRDAVVVGLAPGAGPPPLWTLPAVPNRPAVLAADGAAAICLDAGIVPDVVVTDLDGPVPSEVAAQSRGADVVVHAHGDNLAALERWVPEFSDGVIGSWAGPPGDGLIDFGGFTDGDRAAYLAEAAGADRLLLWGFDLTRAPEEEPAPLEKLTKLRWARAALGLLAEEAPGRLWWWGRDGGTRPVRPLPRPTAADPSSR